MVRASAQIAEDRHHPVKKQRPLAAGTITVPQALLLASVFAAATLYIMMMLPRACALIAGLYIAINSITIQGVDNDGVTPITNAAGVLATVNTISNLCFGPDGILCLGDNVTIAGLRIGTDHRQHDAECQHGDQQTFHNDTLVAAGVGGGAGA